MIYHISAEACAAASNHMEIQERERRNMNLQLRKPALLLGFAFLAASVAFAAPVSEPATGGRATITVTAIGKKDSAPPDITKNDVQLSVDKQRKQIADWSKGDALGLAILIDDALDTNAAGQ